MPTTPAPSPPRPATHDGGPVHAFAPPAPAPRRRRAVAAPQVTPASPRPHRDGAHPRPALSTPSTSPRRTRRADGDDAPRPHPRPHPQPTAQAVRQSPPLPAPASAPGSTPLAACLAPLVRRARLVAHPTPPPLPPAGVAPSHRNDAKDARGNVTEKLRLQQSAAAHEVRHSPIHVVHQKLAPPVDADLVKSATPEVGELLPGSGTTAKTEERKKPATKTLRNNASSSSPSSSSNTTLALPVSPTENVAVTAEEIAFLNAQLTARKKEVADIGKRRRNAVNPCKRTRSAGVTPATTQLRRPTESPKDTFRAYMVDISRSKLLDHAQVTALSLQIRCGTDVERAQLDLAKTLGRRPSLPELAAKLDVESAEVQRLRMRGTAAKNALVSANLRLVTSVANKLSKANSLSTSGITIDDMVQEGSVGLIRAAEKFDASRGYKFSTYATWWIRAYVMRSMTTQGRCIKVPSSVVDEHSRIRRGFTKLRGEGIQNPSDKEVAAELGITVAKLKFVVKVVTQVPASLDTPIDASDEGSRSLSDIVQGDDRVEERMVQDMERRELDQAMRKYLRPIERAVIRLRFGLEDGQPRTFREMGELLSLSKERTRQVMFRALPKLANAEIQQMLLDASTR